MFTPGTILKLLQGVDIDNDYANTLTFPDATTQAAFFISKAWSSFTDFTYMRKEQTVLVPANIEALWCVSYMMFKNANLGDKWFYAFITDMTWKNDSVTEISFEIDVMQTWMFEIEYTDCYVEREHVSNDTVGLHLVEENLNVGEYVIKASDTVAEITALSIIVSTTVDDLGADVEGIMYTHVYSGNAYLSYTSRDDVNALIDYLSTTGKADAINNIFMMPSTFAEPGESAFVSRPERKLIDKTVTKNLYDLDGYVPKNNKLFTYPYNFLVVSNNHGESNIYKYEMSSDSQMVFYVSCDLAPSPTVFLIPRFYKGLTNYEETMRLTGYPLCNWSTDIYKIWMAQNAVSHVTGAVGMGISLGVGVATLNPVAISSGLLGVANSIGQFYEKSILPNPSHGSASGSGNVSQGIQNFSFYKKTIRSEFARIIDNFFDRFGYKVNELKTPSIKTRLNWNYLKTLECNISGNIPNKDLRKIHEILTNGVTFWHNDNVGNYNRANPTI